MFLSLLLMRNKSILFFVQIWILLEWHKVMYDCLPCWLLWKFTNKNLLNVRISLPYLSIIEYFLHRMWFESHIILWPMFFRVSKRIFSQQLIIRAILLSMQYFMRIMRQLNILYFLCKWISLLKLMSLTMPHELLCKCFIKEMPAMPWKLFIMHQLNPLHSLQTSNLSQPSQFDMRELMLAIVISSAAKLWYFFSQYPNQCKFYL